MDAPEDPKQFSLKEPALLSDVARQHANEMMMAHELHGRVQALQDWIARMHRLYPEQ